jgi:hypothetical protein
MDLQELGGFALDFIDNLIESQDSEREIINIVIAVAHRDPDEPGDAGYAYRTAVSDETENVALILDVLKAELTQGDDA